jgi:hypothetical protein
MAFVDYKDAYADLNVRFDYQEAVTAAPILEISNYAEVILKSIEPKHAYKKHLDARVKRPEKYLKTEPEDDFLPAVAYPDIQEPMYKYLSDIDKEFLLPNLELIPQNTVSLLRTNQKFIEAYLVGLNHEMGRELLWREYPTDQRGSYFRQFWDVRGLKTPESNAASAESLKDIAPIHKWKKNSKLGKHNARDAEGDSEQLVFIIRGDLLKKFPNTVIYAHKCMKNAAGEKVVSSEPNAILFPQYQAELLPDIKLLGFDLTIEEAAGSVPGKGFADDLGWFFIIAEVPGEPRFGMDINYKPNKPDEFTWNDLSWENFNGEVLAFVQGNIPPKQTGKPAGDFIPPNNPKTGDWGKSSADMAAILLQRPVMIATHATEMLDIKVPDVNVELRTEISLRAHVRFFRP